VFIVLALAGRKLLVDAAGVRSGALLPAHATPVEDNEHAKRFWSGRALPSAIVRHCGCGSDRASYPGSVCLGSRTRKPALCYLLAVLSMAAITLMRLSEAIKGFN